MIILKKGGTITSEYYWTLWDQLDTEICEKIPGLEKKKIIFRQYKATAYGEILTIAELYELKYVFPEQPPYSPDI